jgi:hypothetical protein
MPSVSDIQAVRAILRTATTFETVFGKLPRGDAASQKNVLRKQFNYLARQVHPDIAPREGKLLAGEVFGLLIAMRKSAETAIESGTYHMPFKAGAAPEPRRPISDNGQTLQSAKALYQLHVEPYRTGDFSVLYQARTLTGTGGSVLIKIATDPTHNTLLEKEVSLLKRFVTRPRLQVYVPTVTDTFVVSGDAGRRYRAIVITPHTGALSLTDIRAALGRPLEAVEVAWVGRRIIAQSLAALAIDVVHGSIVPDHVLVDPLTREPQHIGWLHAVERKTAERITMVIDCWRDWYPPEVMDKKTPGHRSDLYMVGKTMIWLLGGDVRRNTLPKHVPSAMAACILQCVLADKNRRPKDGRQLLDDFTRVVRKEWKREYRPLVLPGTTAGTRA